MSHRVRILSLSSERTIDGRLAVLARVKWRFCPLRLRMINDDGLHRVIEVLAESDLSGYLPRLRDDLQVTKLAHFTYVQSLDLERIGLSKPSIRRLLAAVKQKQRNASKKNQDSNSNSNSNSINSLPSISCLISPSSLALSSTTLGSGHYGIVREGRWNDIRVAVKILRPCQLIGDFVREANAMHQLSHPYLLRLYGIVLSDPLMLVTELAPLGSLSNRLRDESKHFLVVMLVEYGRQISEGMNYLEQRRCVHRDLAARNIFLVSYEQIKIGDFGLARTIDSETNVSKSPSQSIPVAWCAPESLRRQEFSSASDVWMFGVTLWELFTLAMEQPWAGYSVTQILQSIEERNERLPCPDRCPASIYNLLLSCWALNSKDRPHFHQISAHLTSSRPKQSRVHRDHKELHHLTLLRGDTISVFDSSPEKALWKGQNHRTQQVGLFPRLCLSTSTSNENISWPVQGSFIHTGHRHGTGQGISWGNIDSIDETILNNPIVSSRDRNDNVQIVSNLLQINAVRGDCAVVTRPAPAPPIPNQGPTIVNTPTSDDLCLIDLSDPSPSVANSLDRRFHELRLFDPIPLEPSNNSSINPSQFLAQLVSGVTEQLENDSPRLSPSKPKDFTPPLIRRFTIPYPSNLSSSSSSSSSYMNVSRQN